MYIYINVYTYIHDPIRHNKFWGVLRVLDGPKKAVHSGSNSTYKIQGTECFAGFAGVLGASWGGYQALLLKYTMQDGILVCMAGQFQVSRTE